MLKISDRTVNIAISKGLPLSLSYDFEINTIDYRIVVLPILTVVVGIKFMMMPPISTDESSFTDGSRYKTVNFRVCPVAPAAPINRRN